MLQVTHFIGLVCLCALFGRAQDIGTVPASISVCELLREPSRFNGKTIAVRGIYLPWEHGLYLRGEGCDMVRSSSGKDWPAVISIVLTTEEMRRRGLDPERLKAAEVQIAMEKARETTARGGEGKIAKVVLTYVGFFETRDGTTNSRGFGAGAAAPGQLFVESVRDIVVEFEDNATKK
jgi:hypothetical protein